MQSRRRPLAMESSPVSCRLLYITFNGANSSSWMKYAPGSFSRTSFTFMLHAPDHYWTYIFLHTTNQHPTTPNSDCTHDKVLHVSLWLNSDLADISSCKPIFMHNRSVALKVTERVHGLVQHTDGESPPYCSDTIPTCLCTKWGSM